MLKGIKLLFILFFVFVISGFSLLFFSGIKIDSFSYGNINISQFYLKFDKKLIVDIDNIEIKSKKSNVKNSYDDLKKNITLLPKVLKLFQSIHIERLKIDGNEFTIFLNDKSLYLDNKFVNISSKVKFIANEVHFDLYSLYLKDIKLLLDGKVKLDYFNEKLNHYGNFAYKDIQGSIKLDMTTKLAKFYVNSQKFKSLDFIKDFIRLDKEAEAWMYDNVKGDIKLVNFYGEVDLEKEKLKEKSLVGSASISNALIKFHKNLKAIKTEKISVSYKNDVLKFHLEKPTYDDLKMNGSRVEIHNLSSQRKGYVDVLIKTKTKLDEKILNLLKAYDINLPLVQTSGITFAKLNLKIPYLASKKMTTKGDFTVLKSKIKINDFEFLTKKANIILDGTLVKIKNSNFEIPKLLNSTVSLNLDTKTLKAKGDAQILSFLIKENDVEIIDLKNKKTSLSLDFNKAVLINLADLLTEIKIDESIKIKLKDLSSLYNSSKLLKSIPIKAGNLNLDIQSVNDISFNGRLKQLDFPILKDEKKVESLDILGRIKNNDLNINSKNNDIKFSIKDKKQSLFIQNHTILLNTKKEEKVSNDLELSINAIDSEVKVDRSLYYLKSAKANLGKEKTTFEGDFYNLDIPLLKDSKKVTNLYLLGEVLENKTLIQSKDKKLKVELLNDDKVIVHIDSFDLAYSVEEDETNTGELNEINLYGKNSSIIYNKDYKFLADKYELRLRKDNKFFHLAHGKTDFTYKRSANGVVDVFANDISDVFVNTIFNKEVLKGGKLMLLASGTNESLKGKLIITDVQIRDLAVVNTLLLFVHSSPALLNPLLAVPSVVGAAADGFSFTAYEIFDGIMHFDYHKNKETLDITKLTTLGNGIDFEGTGVIDIKNLTLESKIKMIFFKNYSKIVGAIPVVNYVFLGKNKRVSTQVDIFGELKNPKVKTNLTKEAFFVPFNILKRVLTSPIELIDSLKNSEQDKK